MMMFIHVLVGWFVCSPAAGVITNRPALAFAEVRKSAASIREDIVRWRRELHRTPELMYQENKTSQFVQEMLREMGVKFTTGWGKNTRQDRIPGPGGTGVVAEIGTGKPPIVALRADFDALPIEEETPVEFRSEHGGRMHACGHDGHTSMLLGAAKLLQGFATQLQGTVRLIFQPAEEGGAGAKRMCEEGVMEGVSRIFGIHLMPQFPSGSIAGCPGVLLAAGDFFEFQVVGKGGHGAMPHGAVDPIAASAAIVQSLQQIVSREMDPLEPAVVSVTKVQAGDAFNVIPERAVIGGTFRALTTETLNRLRVRLVEVAEAVASAHRCKIEGTVFMPDFFPPTYNNPDLWEWIQSADAGVSESEGKSGVPMKWEMAPIMGSEDFSFYSQAVPGAFILLGQGTGAGMTHTTPEGQVRAFPTNVTVHSPRFNMDESVLDLGAALHTHLALRSLSTLGPKLRAEL